MTQPDPDLWICVTNEAQRWSIWPADLPVPAGWAAQSGPEPRLDCVARIEARWLDQRSQHLKEAMA